MHTTQAHTWRHQATAAATGTAVVRSTAPILGIVTEVAIGDIPKWAIAPIWGAPLLPGIVGTGVTISVLPVGNAVLAIT